MRKQPHPVPGERMNGGCEPNFESDVEMECLRSLNNDQRIELLRRVIADLVSRGSKQVIEYRKERS